MLADIHISGAGGAGLSIIFIFGAGGAETLNSQCIFGVLGAPELPKWTRIYTAVRGDKHEVAESLGRTTKRA